MEIKGDVPGSTSAVLAGCGRCAADLLYRRNYGSFPQELSDRCDQGWDVGPYIRSVRFSTVSRGTE
jgi:hypothetical protein